MPSSGDLPHQGLNLRLLRLLFGRRLLYHWSHLGRPVRSSKCVVLETMLKTQVI